MEHVAHAGVWPHMGAVPLCQCPPYTTVSRSSQMQSRPTVGDGEWRIVGVHDTALPSTTKPTSHLIIPIMGHDNIDTEAPPQHLHGSHLQTKLCGRTPVHVRP